MNYVQNPNLSPEDKNLFKLVPATTGAAAVDLRAAFYDTQEKEYTLLPGTRHTFFTGVSVEIPEECVGVVAIRSGLARNFGLSLMNGIGVIDSDYRGEIGVCIYNSSDQEYTIKHGDRIAQLMILPVFAGGWIMVDSITETKRGAGGFGSTGLQ